MLLASCRSLAMMRSGLSVATLATQSKSGGKNAKKQAPSVIPEHHKVRSRTISTEWKPEEIALQKMVDNDQRARFVGEAAAFRKKHYLNDRHPDLKLLLSGSPHKSYKWGHGQRLTLHRLLLLPLELRGTLDIPEFTILGKRVVETGDWKLFDKLWAEYQSRNLPRTVHLDNIRLSYFTSKGEMEAAWQHAEELKQAGHYNEYSDMHLLLGMLKWRAKLQYGPQDIDKFFNDMESRRKGSESWPSPMVVGKLIPYWTEQKNLERIKQIVQPLGDALTHHVVSALINAYWTVAEDYQSCHHIFERYRSQNKGKAPRAAWQEITPVWEHMRANSLEVPRLQES